MVTYVMLMKLTEHGAREIKGAPARIDSSIKLFESMGGHVRDFFAVAGAYDYVAIGEAPDDQTAMTFSLALGSLGTVEITSLKAFGRAEFADIVGRVPMLALTTAHA
jgi:uncharacterized protein with GYD domain